jgi:hypothetical protein
MTRVIVGPRFAYNDTFAVFSPLPNLSIFLFVRTFVRTQGCHRPQKNVTMAGAFRSRVYLKTVPEGRLHEKMLLYIP